MATKPLPASTLPWLWVIEALARFKPVEVPVLTDLVERIPEISDDLGKDAREIVSFRVLESLFAEGIGVTNDVDSTSDSKIGFDPSEHFEDILRHVLHQTSASSLKMAGQEMLKWDVKPFLMHKRSCSIKCVVQQLKEGILEGSHSLLESWKEQTGLATRNQSEDRISVDGGDLNGVAQRLRGSDGSFQIIAEKRNLVSLPPKNGDGVFQENLPNTTLLPAKRLRNVSATENLQSHKDQIITDNSCIPCSNATKKLKRDTTCTRDTRVQNSVSLHRTELVEDSSGRIVDHTEREGCGLSKEPQAGGLDTSKFPKVGSDEDSALKKAKEDSEGIADVRTSDSPHLNVIHLGKNSVDEAKSNRENSNRENGFIVAPSDNAKVDTDHNPEHEMSSDSDSYHDERIDVATKKYIFLSSQCTYSSDSLATANCSELNLCMKCNKGGHFLVCSSDACPIVIHESCLGSVANFDEMGSFYCPFCAYSRVISEYLEIKKKVSLARKDLAAFIGLRIEHQPKRSSKRLHRSEKNQIRHDEDLDENNETSDKRNGVRVNKSRCRVNKEDKQQAEPSATCVNYSPAHGKKAAALTNGTHSILTEDKREREKVGQECQSLRGLEEKQAVHNHEGDKSSWRDTEIVTGSEKHAEIGMNQEIIHQPVANLPREPVCPSSIEAEGSSEEEEDKFIASNYSIRSRKQEMQYTYPVIPQLRRKTLAWTKVEEETLKEGVGRFSRMHDKSIPWKNILEFGGKVFQKGRTTMDLKNKWRNICK